MGVREVRVLAVIPARLGSTRLPRKMLADVGGKPLIVRTLSRVRKGIRHVVVATDSEEIAAAVTAAGGRAVLTSECRNGTERVAEAVASLDPDSWDVIVNVQGDEPLVDPELPRQLAALLELSQRFEIVTARAPAAPEDVADRARVKVAVDRGGQALAFSRAPIPGHPPWVHVGVYAFRPATLARVVALPPHPAEEAERLEQLRWLARGIPIGVVDVDEAGPSVDTEEDLLRVRARLRGTSRPRDRSERPRRVP